MVSQIRSLRFGVEYLAMFELEFVSIVVWYVPEANLLFHPGLSTAEHISNVSGRGVGMDVVKNKH
jgi:hypothetical protein